ncbi:hypothetical protein AC578_3188 [Pseudocercospora eumusae]|uniref:BTB domain-containing protein n=1 Tax=Pseudocercospora eumusae TaxID=321146 RepID=A0A139H5L2_9PEZI|nr:hypothetical protein AC578_3188 [Pseudocercospora eumusae]
MSPVSDFIDKLDTQIVTVSVGGDGRAKHYAIPAHVLRMGSQWFENALKDGRFQEGQSSTISLPEDSPDVFDLFLYYAYHGQLCFDDYPRDLETRSNELATLFEAWVFGDKYFIAPFQNCAMHRICHLLDDTIHTGSLTPEVVAKCWLAANDASPLRLLLADYIVARMGRDDSFEMPPTQGLIRELHKSWKARDDLCSTSNAKNFPRFRKPTKFAELLYVSPRDQHDGKDDIAHYGYGWNKRDSVSIPAYLPHAFAIMSPAARLIEDLSSELITVKVGVDDDQKEYKVPRALLSKSSPWFEAALKGDRFKEGRTATIELPEDRADVFELFVYFLYRGVLELDSTNSDLSIQAEHLLLCCRTWTFAEKYLLQGLQNCAMHGACFLLNHEFDHSAFEPLPAATLASCWQASTQDSPIRDILADYIVLSLEDGSDLGMEQHMADCPGMMRAMHASEAFFYNTREEGDFPRYKRPVKMSHQLRISFPEEKRPLIFTERVIENFIECGECGFCRNWCHLKDCKHDQHSYKILCSDCYYGYKD